MMEEDGDCIDLLKMKDQSNNIDEFYQKEEIDNLKNQIMMNMPGLGTNIGAGSHTNLVTEADTDCSDAMPMTKNTFANPNII